MILVTGASGTIGRELVQELSRANVRARGGYHTIGKAPKLPNLEAVPLDYDKPDTVRAALEGVERLFLLAAGPRQLEQELTVAEHARRAGVKHLVKLSV